MVMASQNSWTPLGTPVEVTFAFRMNARMSTIAAAIAVAHSLGADVERAAAGLALLPALVVAGAAPAAAHDELIRTAPAVGETATTAPSEVSLTFSGELIDGEGIQNLLQVRDADGNQWQSAAGTVDGPTFSAPLCEGLPNGDYEVAYRVVYSDGHSEERSFDFAVDDPAALAEQLGVAGASAARHDPL